MIFIIFFKPFICLCWNDTQIVLSPIVVSANMDNAEGGLDALMQSVVCLDHIGWAETSRKMVLLATDGILHFAGDGKVRVCPVIIRVTFPHVSTT